MEQAEEKQAEEDEKEHSDKKTKENKGGVGFWNPQMLEDAPSVLRELLMLNGVKVIGR